MQQIVAQFLIGGDPEIEVAQISPQISPWMNLRLPPKVFKLQLVAAQTYRRFLKT
jgi:aryl sulfotransferase